MKHNLKKHFEGLSLANQKAIREYHKEILKTDSSLQSEYAKLKQDGQNPDQIFDFDNALQSSANAFVQSRYPFDPRFGMHAYLAAPIEIATRRVIVDRHPGWDGAFWALQFRPHIPPTSQVR
jgi:hypothetical protein